jgi:hypothetical protein
MQANKAKKAIKKKTFNTNTSNNITSQQKVLTTTKTLRFINNPTYNEKDHNLPLNYNSNDITYNCLSNLEIPEYTIIPKDERAYFEEYKNYFLSCKLAFLRDLNIAVDDPFLESEKFILLVTFDNFEGKLSLSELVLVDPLNGYKRYYVKFEQPDTMREYHLFSGQIVYVNGVVKNDEIFINKLILGMNLLSFNLNENFVKGFFKEVILINLGITLSYPYHQWTNF